MRATRIDVATETPAITIEIAVTGVPAAAH
jgi:hypothetical protein